MLLVRQAVRVHEVAVAGADLPGFGVHQIGKAINRAARRLGQSFGRIVARFEQQSVEQILG